MLLLNFCEKKLQSEKLWMIFEKLVRRQDCKICAMHVPWSHRVATPVQNPKKFSCLSFENLDDAKIVLIYPFFVIPALFISLITIFSYFFYFSVQIKEPANESSTIRGHSIDRGMHHSTYPEERGLFFRGYRNSSNIRCPQKIVAPNFSCVLIGYRGISTRPIFNFKPFLKPFDLMYQTFS